MRMVIDPGKERRSINFVDNICFSHVVDLEGKPLDLYMSLMLQNGNSEMRLAAGRDDEVSTGLQPCLVWINGAGWRGADKNLMAAEMEYFAENGFAVACIDYRSSAQGKWPCQLVDCKTAVRFLRGCAGKYGIDPDHIVTMGRSAGGQLSAFMAMNTDGYDSEEWGGYSSQVCAGVDYFGPTDMTTLNKMEQEKVKNPSYRWHSLKETHGGALLGGDDDEEILRRSDTAAPINFINERTAPIAIFHGDEDPLIPWQISENFYNALVDAGLEEQSEFYLVRNGGHGTRELFQPMVKELVLKFFQKYV